MSDETPAPPLRLRPRLKPEGEPAAPAVPAAPPAASPPPPPLFKTDEPAPAAASAGLAGLPKLRMKPRLTSDEPATATEPAASPAGSPPPPILFAPPLPAGAAPAPSSFQPPSGLPALPALPPQPVLFKTDAPSAAPAPAPLSGSALPPAVPPLLFKREIPGGAASSTGAAPPLTGSLRPPPLRPSNPPMPMPQSGASQPDSEAAPRLKLKPLGATGDAPAGGTASEGTSLLASALNKTSVTMPPIPLPETAPLLPPLMGRAPVIHLTAPGNLPESALQPAVKAALRKAEHRPSSRMGLLIGAVVLLLACAGGGVWAYFKFVAGPAADEQTVTSTTVSPAISVPPVTIADAQTAPPATVPASSGSVQNTLNERREREQDRVDAVIEGREPSDKRALDTPPPSALMKSESQPTPPVSVSTARNQLNPAPAIELPAAAGQAFRRWADSVVISGVFQGNPPRILIGGRTLRPGDVADASLGIVFEGIDAERKVVTFRDRSGATTTKKY